MYQKIIFTLAILVFFSLTTVACSLADGTWDNDSLIAGAGLNASNDSLFSEDDDNYAENNASLFQCNDENFSEEWQRAYTDFLRDYAVHDEYSVFSLWDFEGNNIPELLIRDTSETGIIVITVYSYNGSVDEVGHCSGVNDSAGLLTSSNPMFPGLFTSKWGGGVTHYFYIDVNEGGLTDTYLWYYDTTVYPEETVEISDDQQLVNESFEVYAHFDLWYCENYEKPLLINETIDSDAISKYSNLLEFHLINDYNIAQLKKLGDSRK